MTGLRLTVDGPVARVVLDRPEVRNAQTPAMWAELADFGTALPSDVRVVVVSGEGPSFSAGLDRRLIMGDNDLGEEPLLSLGAKPADELDKLIAHFQAGFSWLRNPQIVSIAAVQGHAVGAGFQLALAADRRVAALDAWFAMSETSLGLVPDRGGPGPLGHLVGYARALEICATGRKVSAPEALDIGLVGSLAPAADLAETTGSLVEALLAAPSPALRALKPLLRGAVDADRATQLGREREAQTGLLQAMLGGFGA